MDIETLALLASFLMCSETAETRVLSQGEASVCLHNYHKVKLAFADVSSSEYLKLAPAEKAKVNQLGYAAFIAWREDNPELAESSQALGDYLQAIHKTNVPPSLNN